MSIIVTRNGEQSTIRGFNSRTAVSHLNELTAFWRCNPDAQSIERPTTEYLAVETTDGESFAWEIDGF